MPFEEAASVAGTEQKLTNLLFLDIYGLFPEILEGFEGRVEGALDARPVAGRRPTGDTSVKAGPGKRLRR
jgi:hypothetical protein